MNTLAIVIASASGWAIVALAVLMLRQIDLKDGRVLVAGGWLAAACAGGYLGLVPAAAGIAPHWSLLVLALSFAICGWFNFNALMRQATSPSPWTASARYAGAGAVAGAIALLAPATASRNMAEPRPAERPAAKQPINSGASDDKVG